MASAIVSSPSESTDTLVPPKRKLLEGFVRLTPDVSIYTPPSTSLPAPANSPTTILFCSWMNAGTKHIDYYVRNYKKYFPSARIISVRLTTKQFVFTSEIKRRKQIAPVIDALLSFEAENGVENERLVIHAISNGGAKRAYGITGSYLQRTGRKLPAKVFLCDCTPAVPEFWRDWHALTLPLKKMNFLVALPLYVFIFLTVIVTNICTHILPKWVWKELVWAPLATMNDPAFIAKTVLRGYIYSEEDISINYKSVESYAQGSRDVGYKVVQKKVEGAGHAMLWKGKGGEEDYWGWIRDLYEIGLGLRK